MSEADETTKLIATKTSSSSSLSSFEQTSDMGDYSVFSSFLIFIFPASGGLLFGYDIGSTSASIIQIQSKSYSGIMWWETIHGSSLLQGVITSIGMLGAVMGCLICFKVADRIGRRWTIITAACLYCLGSIIEFVSGDPDWDINIGLTVLLLGRLIYGFGCGFAMQGAPSYIGEMAPTQIRGLLISMKEAFIVLGMLLGYSIGYGFSSIVGGWRYTYGIASIYSIFMLLGMYMLPESSRWLALNHRRDEAIASLRYVTPHPTKTEMLAIEDLVIKSTPYTSSESSISEDYQRLTSPSTLPALIAGVGLVFFQQVTGQPSVLYYANTIFRDIGVSSIAAIAISLFKLVATLLTTVTVDKYGRKVLLYIGCSLMLAALIALAVAFIYPYSSIEECNAYHAQAVCPSSCSWNSDQSSSCDSIACSVVSNSNPSLCPTTCCSSILISPQKIIIIMALFLYIGGYQVGFGPISWLIVSEIFPLQIRGKAVSIAVVVNFILNFLVSLLFPIELHSLGPSITFIIFAAILTWSLYFIMRYVPETKGLSLEAIEEYFKKSIGDASPLSIDIDTNDHDDDDDGDDNNDDNGGDYVVTSVSRPQTRRLTTSADKRSYINYQHIDAVDPIDAIEAIDAMETDSYTYFSTTQTAVRSRSTSLSSSSSSMQISEETKKLLSIL